MLVRPTLPPLTVDAIPANLGGHVNLAAHLAEPDWDRLQRTALRAAGFR